MPGYNSSASEISCSDWLSGNGSDSNCTNETAHIEDYLTNSSVIANFAKFITFLDKYFMLAIIVIGLVGNALSFCVFVFTYLNRLSSSVYLAALACADAGFLFCLLVSWANNIGIHLYNTPGWCQLFVYCSYIFSFLSVWFVVCFTVERYVAVCIPLRRQDMCTPRRAKIVVVALSVVSAVLYNFALWTSAVQDIGIDEPQCHYLTQYIGLINYANNIDTILTLVVPSCMIIVANVRIVYAVILLQRQRRKSETRERLNVLLFSSDMSMPRSHHSRAHSSQMKVTQMLIIVSSIFLLLNLPSHFMRLYAFIMSMVSDSFRTGRLFILVQRLFLYVYQVNFSINFFLYNACGRNFRRAMLHLFRNVRYRLSKNVRGRRDTNGEDYPVMARIQKSSSSSSQKRADLLKASSLTSRNRSNCCKGAGVQFQRIVMTNGTIGNPV